MAFTGAGKPDVDKMMSKRDVEGLIDALDYTKDTNVRSRAAQALGDVFDGRVVGALGKALKDEDAGVRMDAVHSLGRVKVPHSMEVLALALKDPDPGIRSLAQKMLISHVHSLKVEPDVDGLVMAMKSEDNYIRLNAVSALGEVGDERAVEALAAICLRDPYYPVRFEAAESLRKVGDNRAAGILADSLVDNDRTVRLRAAEALGKIGDRRAISALSVAMEDKDDAVRAAAMCSAWKDRRSTGHEHDRCRHEAAVNSGTVEDIFLPAQLRISSRLGHFFKLRLRRPRRAGIPRAALRLRVCSRIRCTSILPCSSSLDFFSDVPSELDALFLVLLAQRGHDVLER